MSNTIELDRDIILTAQTILEIFKDYCGEDNIPANTIVESVKMNPQFPGKIALQIYSPDFKDSKPLEVNVDLRKM